jgi:hypothetical protein
MKPWYQSKTVLVNALILLLAVADAAQALPIPATWAPYIIAAASVLNVALRLTTNTGLTSGVPLGEDPAYRAAHDASGDPALPNGGHPKRAPSRPPVPRGAPAPADRGAPSLADQIAHDNGMDPPDTTPEDTI